MTYEELKKIAQPHIREKDNLPSNALLLLTQLHIPYKTEKQCEKDFEGKYNPLDNYPAFLFVKGDEKVLYFKTTTRYYNFYIFHEIAHYILGHEDDNPQNELDANMLACILAAPIENLPTNTKTAQDLSSACTIPIDKAEEYWAEIKHRLPKRKLSAKRKFVITSIICVIIMLLSSAGFVLSKKLSNQESKTDTTEQNSIVHTQTQEQKDLQEGKVYVTTSGTKYHLPNCRYVKYKTNITGYNTDDAINKGYEPCKICIK